jgi:chromosome segregation ATPase
MQFKVTQAQNRITYLDGVCKEHEVSAVKHSAVHKSTLDEFEIVKVELDSAVRGNKRLELKISDSQLSLDQITEQVDKSRLLSESLGKRCERLEGDCGVLNSTLDENRGLLEDRINEIKGLKRLIDDLESGKTELDQILSDKSNLIVRLEELVVRLRVDVKDSGDLVLELESASLLRVLENGKSRDEERMRLDDVNTKLESEREDWVNAQLESKEACLFGF